MTTGTVVVATVQGQFAEAQLRAFLEAQGIPTAVRGEALRATHGLSVDGLGAVQILVPAEREEEARALLAAVDDGKFRLPDEVTEVSEDTEATESTDSHGDAE